MHSVKTRYPYLHFYIKKIILNDMDGSFNLTYAIENKRTDNSSQNQLSAQKNSIHHRLHSKRLHYWFKSIRNPSSN